MPSPRQLTGTSHVSLDAGILAQINRLTTIARMVPGMAHELNNSLQVIGGLVELLADRADVPADVAGRLQKIGGQTDRASGVIRHVLAYERDPGGEPTLVDFAATVERSLALRRYQLGRAGVTVMWERLPGEAYRVTGEDRLLQQAVLNLLVNAEEALEGQSIRRLTIGLSHADGLVRLAIADSGHGVPADLRGRIFEPFFTTRSSPRAVGLGLPVASAIAAAHGGRLYLADGSPDVGPGLVVDRPSPGEGATFVFEVRAA